MYLKGINKNGDIDSACFLYDNYQNYIISSNDSHKKCESIKIFDFNGNKIKEINDSRERVFFIDTYYEKKIYKNYIITGNYGYIKSYDYNENRIYHKYSENDKSSHLSIIVNNKEEIIKLIDSSLGNIRIWNFHSGELMNKIIMDNKPLCICLWNDDYLCIGCDDSKIKLVEIKNGRIINNLISHNNFVITIKKIIHPKLGKCLISQGWFNEPIKIWANEN